ALTLQVFFSKTFLKLASSSSSLKTTLLIYPTFSLLANPLFVRVIDDTHGCVVTYFLFSTLLFANLLFISVFYRHLSSAITELLVQNIF
ncbi:hypothetical protein, partial [Lactobacillus helveticus]|uniref:hypothetical protein n=2 Tax=Lactobacillus helveticus TaxID=1587 RepID=UPI001C6535C9